MKNNIGDIKKVERFAFLPIKVKGKWKWLTSYICVYKYIELRDVDGMNTFYYDDWVVLERKEK